MDSVTLTVLIIAVIVAGPAALKCVTFALAKLAKFASKRIKRAERKRMLKDKDYQKQKLQSKGLKDDLGKKVGVRFFNSKKKSSQKLNVVMDKGCDIEEDIILKGMLTVVNKEGKTLREPIYLFQPELFNGKGEKLGPIPNKDGSLSDNNPYFAKMSNGDIGRGYALKREVTTGMCFDFVKGSMHAQIPGLENFISIEIPRDKNGNYIPVDMNNAKELAAFKAYIESRRTMKSVPSYLHYLISMAEEAKANARTVYAEAGDVYSVDEEREAKEEAERDANEKHFDSNAHLKIYEEVYGLKTQLMMDEMQEQGAMMLPPKNIQAHRVMGARQRYTHNQMKR